MGDTEPRSPAKVEPRPVGRQPSVAVTEEEFRARPGCLDRAAGRSGNAAVMTRGGGRPQDGLRCAALRCVPRSGGAAVGSAAKRCAGSLTAGAFIAREISSPQFVSGTSGGDVC